MQLTLKAARINAGFTQEELAEKLFRTRVTISRWESGPWVVPETLRRFVAKQLGVKPQDIQWTHTTK